MTHRILLSFIAFVLLLPGLALASESPSGKSFDGKNPLGVSRGEFAATQEGMDLIYQRRYEDALHHFERMGFEFPASPVGPIGRALVYQSEMFEEYNFNRERAYATEIEEFESRLRAAERRGRTPEWLAFLKGVYLGVDAMYDIRKGSYVKAFDKAWDALEEMKRIARRAPEFKDVQLALGVYNYWRTVITESVPFLPRFGNHRDKGLRQMREAREEGLLAATPASFALTFSLIEKGEHEAAISEAKRTGAEYPGSILNSLILAQAYRKAERYDEALTLLKGLLATHPKVQRTWFHIGEVHYKSRKNNVAARAAYERYLESGPTGGYKAYTLYRLGQLDSRARNYEGAIARYEAALVIEPKFKRAQKRLDDAKRSLAKVESGGSKKRKPKRAIKARERSREKESK